MRFVDREEELRRLEAVTRSPGPALVVVWGRRRIGKTRVLLEWVGKTDGLYWVADESAPPIQRRYFAEALEARIAGFGQVEYRDWEALFARLGREMDRARWRGPIVIDELPYLVAAAPELPSVLQRFVDLAGRQSEILLALAGSSQRMMQGLVLDARAPLYGRAREAMKLRPILPGWLGPALGLRDPRAIVEAWTLWGGIPRYWELASSFSDQNAAADALVLDPLGPLHDEPARLLLEESPSAVSLRPLLDAIGAGAHRVSEIAARVGQAATSLARPLTRLQELDLVLREIPFGEPERAGKRALYRIADPFLRLWFAVVGPRRSWLLQAPRDGRLALVARALPRLRAMAWEELCRLAVPRLAAKLGGVSFGQARRFWRGGGPEWDVVAESVDGSVLLLGEARWPERDPSASEISEIARSLMARGAPPIRRPEGGLIHHAIFVPRRPPGLGRVAGHVHVIDAAAVVRCLR
ncbi:MAG: ATP-binding protein [Deltaproteobacteria bacterium]|nr:ATP-binding protein [Deltaproteobacteria bacterium]